MFLELIKDLIYSFYVWLARVFGIDQDVVQIYDDKRVEFLGKDFIVIVLESDKSFRKSKKHDWIL